MRTMILPTGDVWRWRVSKGGTVVLFAPDGAKHCVRAATLKGVTEDTFARGRAKQTRDGAVMPSEIRTYIESELVVMS